MRSSGKMSAHQNAALILVQIFPGKTASNLADRTAMAPPWSCHFHERRQQIRRRLSDLRALGMVRREKGQGESVWYAI